MAIGAPAYTVLLAALLIASSVAAVGREYRDVGLLDVAASPWTHVRTVGVVAYVRAQADGDWHLTLTQPPDAARLVAEIIPGLPLPVPRKGQRIRVWGILRRDVRHGWAEIHPVEGWDDATLDARGTR